MTTTTRLGNLLVVTNGVSSVTLVNTTMLVTGTAVLTNLGKVPLMVSGEITSLLGLPITGVHAVVGPISLAPGGVYALAVPPRGTAWYLISLSPTQLHSARIWGYVAGMSAVFGVAGTVIGTVALVRERKQRRAPQKAQP